MAYRQPPANTLMSTDLVPPRAEAYSTQPAQRHAPPKGMKRLKRAPLPAPASVPAPTAAQQAKWLQTGLSQMRGLNNLRGMRMRTAGGIQP